MATEFDAPLSATDDIQQHESVPPSSASLSPPAEPEPRQLLLGSWQDDFHGKRVFTFNDDGTATMVLHLDTIGSLLYGERLRFDIRWTWIAGTIEMEMVGGDPPEATKSLAKLFGEKSRMKIELLAADELHLRTGDTKKVTKHKRLANDGD